MDTLGSTRAFHSTASERRGAQAQGAVGPCPRSHLSCLFSDTEVRPRAQALARCRHKGQAHGVGTRGGHTGQAHGAGTRGRHVSWAVTALPTCQGLLLPQVPDCDSLPCTAGQDSVCRGVELQRVHRGPPGPQGQPRATGNVLATLGQPPHLHLQPQERRVVSPRAGEQEPAGCWQCSTWARCFPRLWSLRTPGDPSLQLGGIRCQMGEG